MGNDVAGNEISMYLCARMYILRWRNAITLIIPPACSARKPRISFLALSSLFSPADRNARPFRNLLAKPQSAMFVNHRRCAPCVVIYRPSEVNYRGAGCVSRDSPFYRSRGFERALGGDFRRRARESSRSSHSTLNDSETKSGTSPPSEIRTRIFVQEFHIDCVSRIDFARKIIDSALVKKPSSSEGDGWT